MSSPRTEIGAIPTRKTPTKASVRLIGIAIGLVTLAGANSYAFGSTFKRLYSFHGYENAQDGECPMDGVIRDTSGNLFGTTYSGGSNGSGTVFKLAPGGKETILHSFMGNGDGGAPEAGLVQDSSGNLYGTTGDGGANAGGTIFEVTQDGTETILHSFDYSDGTPAAKLTWDSSGNLYGTTYFGNSVYKLAPDGTYTVLYKFKGGSDGERPQSKVIFDAAGNLYGTTSEGGGGVYCIGGSGCGTVFKLAPDGTETVLHSFSGLRDGAWPLARLTQDDAGNFYGTTDWGGAFGCSGYGCGTVFELTPDGRETVLYRFKGDSKKRGRFDGRNPQAHVTFDASESTVYGTTYFGGLYGHGTIFKMTSDGKEEVVYSFNTKHNDDGVISGFIKQGGNFYGTTCAGGRYDAGTVFEFRP